MVRPRTIIGWFLPVGAVNDVDIAAPIGREVLVKRVQASGLCHTDLLFATHDIVPMPAVLGHEVAGTVAAVGPDAAQIRVGDHVVGSLARVRNPVLVDNALYLEVKRIMSTTTTSEEASAEDSRSSNFHRN